MAKYKKKPVVNEAEVYEAEVYKEGMEDGWEFYPIFSNELICYMTNEEMKTKPIPKTNRIPVIETLEGRMKIDDGDYIVTGIKGERYPCKPDIFKATYEKISD